MAFCPQCHKEMGQTATVCPRCGYDFPPASARGRDRAGFAYSGLATFALLVGQLIAALAGVIAVVGCIAALIQGEWLHAFVLGPIVATLMLGIVVVFARSLDLR
ncbi:MAG TPA: zinc ribbon domain-containing protein [Tepidisphaeraceae bacterium]|jgi:hypothetical protein